MLHPRAQTQYTSIHINTQYQTILHTCGPWHLQRFSCPGRHDLDKEKAACVVCDKVNKCKSHPKNERQPKRLCIFQGKRVFFLGIFYLTEWLKILCECFRIFWQPAGQSASYVYIEGCNYRACSACSISSLSFVVVALLHWLNAGIWVMYGHVLLVSFGSGFLL